MNRDNGNPKDEMWANYLKATREYVEAFRKARSKYYQSDRFIKKRIANQMKWRERLQVRFFATKKMIEWGGGHKTHLNNAILLGVRKQYTAMVRARAKWERTYE